MTCSDCWTLLLCYLKYLLNINFERVYCDLLIKLIILMWFLYVEWQTRQIPNTHPKPDGYGYGYEFLPVGTGTGTNFYPQTLCWRAGNYSTRPEPDPLSSLIRRKACSNPLSLFSVLISGNGWRHYITVSSPFLCLCEVIRALLETA
jgi:hypothetical protein